MTTRRVLGNVLAMTLPLLLLTSCGRSTDGACPGSDDGVVYDVAPTLVDAATLAVDGTGAHLTASCLRGECSWDTASGRLTATGDGYRAASPDHTLLVRSGHCGALSIDGGGSTHALRGLPADAGLATYVTVGTGAVAASGSGRVVAWEPDGSLRWRIEQAGATRLALSPDGTRLAITTPAGIEIVDPATGHSQDLVHGSGQAGKVPVAAAWSTDGGWLAATTPDGEAALWRTDDLSLVETLPGHHVSSLTFSPDTRTLAVTDADHPGVALWTPKALGGNGAARTLSSPPRPQDGAVFGTRGDRLYTASYLAGVIAWDLRTGLPVPGFDNPKLG